MSLGPLGLMIEHIRGVTKGSKYCKDFLNAFWQESFKDQQHKWCHKKRRLIGSTRTLLAYLLGCCVSINLFKRKSDIKKCFYYCFSKTNWLILKIRRTAQKSGFWCYKNTHLMISLCPLRSSNQPWNCKLRNKLWVPDLCKRVIFKINNNSQSMPATKVSDFKKNYSQKFPENISR